MSEVFTDSVSDRFVCAVNEQYEQGGINIEVNARIFNLSSA